MQYIVTISVKHTVDSPLCGMTCMLALCDIIRHEKLCVYISIIYIGQCKAVHCKAGLDVP